jgi:arginine N-succinyltransferase
MTVIRPVRLADLDALLELTKLTGFGLTTLPHDRDLMRRRILKSQRSFEDMSDTAGGEAYLFVLEEQLTREVVGTCGIVSKVGGFEPFYAYRVETIIHESAMLGIRKQIKLLQLVAEHNGPSEIGSLFLSPQSRKDNNGRLLSLSRFMFMAEHSSAFDPMVIAEMRGVIDDQGRSAFWDALGKHFFEIDFPKADFLSLINKRFIADLMPKHPIYVPLLPEEAQAVIGKVHAQSLPALKLLEGEGFQFHNMVDIFEAGPVVTCPLAEIRTVRDSRKVVISRIEEIPGDVEPVILSNSRGDFRACVGPIEIASDGTAIITPQCARGLIAGVGDSVRFAELRPNAASPRNGAAKEPVIAHSGVISQSGSSATAVKETVG